MASGVMNRTGLSADELQLVREFIASLSSLHAPYNDVAAFLRQRFLHEVREECNEWTELSRSTSSSCSWTVDTNAAGSFLLCAVALATAVFLAGLMLGRRGAGGKGYVGAAALCQVADKTIYLSGSKGMTVVNISSPMDPKCVDKIDTGTISSDGGAACVKIDNTVILAGVKGLRILDVTNVSQQTPVGEVIDTGALSTGAGVDLALNEAKILYVAGCKGLAVYDVTEKATDPAKVGEAEPRSGRM
eukprot:TRINITY_DN14001_c0_g2_i2.p1 TRINITY_DN14001_c0_g2~~TRINITY_DN14001_c0_g2_i2.p1  ORF type:complete len:246 (-),score=45.67 TRINITY_DN14001_c0_g2_i2:35-772(-)